MFGDEIMLAQLLAPRKGHVLTGKKRTGASIEQFLAFTRCGGKDGSTIFFSETASDQAFASQNARISGRREAIAASP